MKFVVFFVHLLLCVVAWAETPIDGFYSSVTGAYVYTPPNINQGYDIYTLNSTKYQGGFEAGGNIGYKSNPMRYEGEIFYLKTNIQDFYLDNTLQTGPYGYNQGLFGMANIYYDFPRMNPILQPYVGAGIGYGWVQAKFNGTGPDIVTNFSADNSSFAYQALAGITLNFAENYAISAGYRYIGTSNLSSFGEMFQAHMAMATATFRFDGNKYR